MGFCHLLASCCPPFTCFPVFLRGREGVLLSWQGLKFALLLQTRPHPVLIQDLLAYTVSRSRTTRPQLSISPSPTHGLSAAAVCKCYIPKCFFSPFLKVITAFLHCILKVVLQRDTDPGMSVSTPSTQTVWLKTSPALQISSKQHDRRTQPQRGMPGHVGNTTRQAQCVKQYTHANTLPLILPKLIKIVNRCTFIQTSAEFWGAPSELDSLFLAFCLVFQ